MAQSKPKPVKVTPAVIKGIASGQVPKQTLSLKRGPTRRPVAVVKRKLTPAPKRKAR